MYKRACPICATPMVKNGFTSAGKQRWRCKKCGYSSVMKNDAVTRDFKKFLAYLFGKASQKEMAGSGRQFRRNVDRFWEIWPLPPVTDRQIDAIYCDAKRIAKNVYIFIAVANTHEVLAWAVAPSERTHDWFRLLCRIDPPKLVITDGCPGEIAAVKVAWKNTRRQRCQFHLMKDVMDYTRRTLRDEATRELHELCYLWKDITVEAEARAWVYFFEQWCSKWQDYLREKYEEADGKVHYRHNGLRRARALIRSVIREKTLFAYVDFADEIPNYHALATNNYIEGAVNSALNNMMRDHRGMPLIHRIKACYWWLYQHSEDPLPIRRLLEIMPTDDELEAMMHPKKGEKIAGSPDEWGSALSWDELRHSRPYSGYIG